jgi:hypothetical protein
MPSVAIPSIKDLKDSHNNLYADILPNHIQQYQSQTISIKDITSDLSADDKMAIKEYNKSINTTNKNIKNSLGAVRSMGMAEDFQHLMSEHNENNDFVSHLQSEGKRLSNILTSNSNPNSQSLHQQISNQREAQAILSSKLLHSEAISQIAPLLNSKNHKDPSFNNFITNNIQETTDIAIEIISGTQQAFDQFAHLAKLADDMPQIALQKSQNPESIAVSAINQLDGYLKAEKNKLEKQMQEVSDIDEGGAKWKRQAKFMAFAAVGASIAIALLTVTTLAVAPFLAPAAASLIAPLAVTSSSAFFTAAATGVAVSSITQFMNEKLGLTDANITSGVSDHKFLDMSNKSDGTKTAVKWSILGVNSLLLNGFVTLGQSITSPILENLATALANPLPYIGATAGSAFDIIAEQLTIRHVGKNLEKYYFSLKDGLSTVSDKISSMGASEPSLEDSMNKEFSKDRDLDNSLATKLKIA